MTEETKSVENIAVPVPAPVVVTKNKVTLADHLDLRSLPLATTPAGKNFAIKTLHPADSEIKVARAPGGTFPTLGIAADMVETLQFPNTAVGAYLLQTPNPMIPLSIVFTDGAGAYVDHYLWTNAALGGPGLIHAPTSWPQIASWAYGISANIDSYRVLSQSVTCEVIAPAVKDQGTIVAAQYHMKPITMQGAIMNTNGGGTVCNSVAPDMWCYRPPPNANTMLMGTSAYTAKSREGVYQPLKIKKFKFVSSMDRMVPVAERTTPVRAFESGTPTALCNFPIYFHNVPFNDPLYVPMLKPSSNAIGIIYIDGTAGFPDVSLRVRARQTMEVVPVIGGTYAPLAEAPFPPDELAFRMVAEIAGRMKDAYPASYNDLGALKGVIQNIGKSVMKYADPVLDLVSAIPGIGTKVGLVRDAAKGIGTAFTHLAGNGTVSKKIDLTQPPASKKQAKSKGKKRGQKSKPKQKTA